MRGRTVFLLLLLGNAEIYERDDAMSHAKDRAKHAMNEGTSRAGEVLDAVTEKADDALSELRGHAGQLGDRAGKAFKWSQTGRTKAFATPPRSFATTQVEHDFRGRRWRRRRRHHRAERANAQGILSLGCTEPGDAWTSQLSRFVRLVDSTERPEKIQARAPQASAGRAARSAPFVGQLM